RRFRYRYLLEVPTIVPRNEQAFIRPDEDRAGQFGVRHKRIDLDLRRPIAAGSADRFGNFDLPPALLFVLRDEQSVPRRSDQPVRCGQRGRMWLRITGADIRTAIGAAVWLFIRYGSDGREGQDREDLILQIDERATLKTGRVGRLSRFRSGFDLRFFR